MAARPAPTRYLTPVARGVFASRLCVSSCLRIRERARVRAWSDGDSKSPHGRTQVTPRCFLSSMHPHRLATGLAESEALRFSQDFWRRRASRFGEANANGPNGRWAAPPARPVALPGRFRRLVPAATLARIRPGCRTGYAVVRLKRGGPVGRLALWDLNSRGVRKIPSNPNTRPGSLPSTPYTAHSNDRGYCQAASAASNAHTIERTAGCQ